MINIDLVFGLHLYQPPTQDRCILDEITKESYLPMIETILGQEKAFFTVDITKSAIEELETLGSGQKFLEKFKKALELKKVFLVNTAAYHQILPLITEEEIIKQVKLNEVELLQLFHQKPQGVFPPEMALDPRVSKVFGKIGYKWTITDDLLFSYVYGLVPFNWIPKQNGIAIFLRSNLWSNRIAFNSINGQSFIETLEKDLTSWFGDQDGYLVIWMDFETFGHHRTGYIESFIIPFLDKIDEQIHLVSPDFLLNKYPQKEIEVPPGSWSTSIDDFKNGTYWPLWKNPSNQFHQLWWELADMILEIKRNIKDEKTLEVFDKALYSCQTWQYSMGNKLLAIKGIKYFREIASLKEVISLDGKANQINQIIDKLEKLCQ
ncbi:MAG TPA: hypothetical protein PLA57_00810 [Candidatus Paceibacterota bacterium]|jgi:predicted glycosyl hydrolase (DUF1957 family)|nr:hypothetical protein [Candidatus Paceibacterota bacterium]